MNILLYCLSIIFTYSAEASIFGQDDRTEIAHVKNNDIQEIARSIPALVHLKNLKDKGGEHYELKGIDYVNKLKFCPDERFVRKQSLVANCSAWLAGEDLVGSAGHCFNEKGDRTYRDFAVVFDYKTDSQGNPPKFIHKSKVFLIEKIIKSEHEYKDFKDYVLFKLQRPVPGRKPIVLNYGQRVEVGTPLFIIGYPFGLPQKYQPNGKVLSVNDNPNSFRHHLDTFSVNSGSAIFNALTHEIVGIHVRGTGTNYTFDKEKNCNRWMKGDPKKDFGEANFIDIALP